MNSQFSLMYEESASSSFPKLPDPARQLLESRMMSRSGAPLETMIGFGSGSVSSSAVTTQDDDSDSLEVVSRSNTSSDVIEVMSVDDAESQGMDDVGDEGEDTMEANDDEDEKPSTPFSAFFSTDSRSNSMSAAPLDEEDGGVGRKRKRYTMEEDKLILDAVKKHGEDWNAIAGSGVIDRDAGSIKRRYRIIIRDRVSEADDTESERTPKKRKLIDQYLTRTPTSSSSTGANASPSGQTSLTISEQRAKIAELERDIEKMKEEQRERESVQAVAQQKLLDENRRLEDQLLKLKGSEQAVEQLGNEVEQLRTTLEGTLIDLARRERAQAREKARQNRARVGSLQVIRRGAGIADTWKDGDAFVHNQLRVAEIRRIRAEKEQVRKQIASQKKSAKAAKNDREYWEACQRDEAIKIHLNYLKKTEEELNKEREQMNQEKHVLIKEFRRIADEDSARFLQPQVLAPENGPRIVLLELLGKGGFSEVYKGFDVKRLKHVACKIHQVNPHWSDEKKTEYSKHALRECAIQTKMKHPRIVSVYDAFEIDLLSFCTVQEYCPGGDLDLYLKQKKSLPEREARCIVSQIFSGLRYLNEQERPIIHYDLKPANILYHEGEVRITDFGLAKMMEPEESMMELTSQGAGTYWYLPPECFAVGPNKPKISSKVDVWSAGVMFFQLLYGTKPFGHDRSQQAILRENLISTSVLVQFPDKPTITEETKSFIRTCLTPDHNKRPDVLSICEHPYLKMGK